MKKILLILFLFLGTFAVQAQDINWMSLEEALAKQKRVPKPIFMDVYTEWCGPCKMLDKNTFQDPAVVDYVNKNYYAVKFNAEGNSKVNYQGAAFNNPGYDPNRKGRNSAHELTKHLKVPGYPSMYILDKKGNVQETLDGYKTPEELLKSLKN
ncbi:thioredoxin family protein [Flavobacterium amnicola]|jgi:thioredoxin-related protein|uniref:Thioredoxin family protein n=1 Tax=Flavobacterium amnicola TaxID=2506422 RepID=A0A4Q1K6R9_9FLAO|nr:thioredoxin fold domain-containing protein [Flavobacterium amnicola]RXR21302.1 thioredoxin family protein [Flavobacterium amnicola]